MRGDSGYAYLPAGQAEVEFSKYEQRIRQLEKQCEVLAAEVDKMRPVVEAAIVHLKNPNGLSMEKRDAGLWMAVTTYEASNPK